ncbi:MAG TPA: hypothetical protein VGN25_01245 [Solirubrobacteraceae bacterium]|nr:hypothetical protein [Solirubrobacteraceae bacterium]
MVIAVGTALVVLFAGACVILAVGRSVPTELWAAAGSLSGALVGILAPPPSQTTLSAVAATQAAAETAHESAVTAAKGVAAKQESEPAREAAERAVKAAEAQTPVDAMKLSASPVRLPSRELATAAFARVYAKHRGAAEHARALADEAAGQSSDRAGSEVRVEEANATRDVLEAAAKGAQTAEGQAVKAGVEAGAAAPHVRLEGVDKRVLVLLLVGAIAFIAGIVLALQVGHDAAKESFEDDVALKNAATTLIALGSSAGGALVGLLAPQASAHSGEGATKV